MKSCSAVLLFVMVAGCAVQTLHTQKVCAGVTTGSEKQKIAGAANAAGESTAADEVASLPVMKLTLSEPKPVSGVPEFHMWATPVLCGLDGTPYVSVFDPKDYRSRTLYSLGQAGGRAFSTAAVPGLYDITLMSQFVGDGVVGFLVNATSDDTKEPNRAPVVPFSPSPYLYTGEHHSFVIELDEENAQFKRTVELPKQYMFWRVTALEGDSLLALAYDRVNSVPRLLVVDTDGKIIRTLEVPQSLTQNAQLQEGTSGDFLKQAKAETTMSYWEFAPVRKKVLLYQRGSHAPVLEVGAGGAVREVPLDAPKGYTLHAVVPANDRWLMRFQRDGLDSEGKGVDARPESGNYLLYEVDPNDGSLKRQIDLVTGTDFEISCEVDGSLIGFLASEKLMRVTAEIGR
jgi:hypothetical protein